MGRKEARPHTWLQLSCPRQRRAGPWWPCHSSPVAGPGDRSAPTSKDKHALLPPRPAAEEGLRKEESPLHTPSPQHPPMRRHPPALRECEGQAPKLTLALSEQARSAGARQRCKWGGGTRTMPCAPGPEVRETLWAAGLENMQGQAVAQPSGGHGNARTTGAPGSGGRTRTEHRLRRQRSACTPHPPPFCSKFKSRELQTIKVAVGAAQSSCLAPGHHGPQRAGVSRPRGSCHCKSSL